MKTGVRIGPHFTPHDSPEQIARCEECKVPADACTGGDGKCPLGCQFYEEPSVDGCTVEVQVHE